MELAVILPVLLVIVVGMWDMGQLIRGLQIVSTAAREGGRQAAAGAKTLAQIQNIVTLTLTQNGINASNVAFNYTNATHSGYIPTAASQSDVLNVTISIPFADMQFASGAYGKWRTGVPTLAITSQWQSMRDQPVNVAVTIPSG